MANPQLVQYIKKEKAQGYTIAQLKAQMLKQGYHAAEISEALTAAKGPSPAPTQGKGIKERNPILVLIFALITFGIYGAYWVVSTTLELRDNTKSAPNPWLLLLMLVPFVNFIVPIYYYWKYSQAINELTGFTNVGLFVLWIFISPVAMVLAQIELNKKAA